MIRKKNKTHSSTKKVKKSESYDSILVHFGPKTARFNPSHLKLSRSFITVPTAWKFKPLTEVCLDVHIPGAKRGMIQCHGIIINCRPIAKKKGQYQIDLLLSHIPKKYEKAFDRFVPQAKLT